VLSRLILICLLTITLLVPHTAHALPQQSVSELPVYAYEFRLNTSIDYVVSISNDLVVVLGSLGGVSVVQFINISDPFKGPQIVFTYPLTGSLTSYAVDGYPVNYLAVGTDLGEVLVFKVMGGRLYGMLHYVQGDTLVVRKLYLLRTPTTTKLITLSVDRLQPSERYVYVYDVNVKRVVKLGPLVGNLTYGLEYITPYDLIPVKVVGSDGYYYDPSKVLITYSGLTATLIINATYYFNNTLLPASNAYVEIYLYNVSDSNLVLTYGSNLDVDGIGYVDVPLGYLTYVYLYDIYGNRYREVINLSDITRPKTIYLNFTLLYRPDTRVAITGLPLRIKVFDFTLAPINYTVVKDLDITTYPDIPIHMFRPSGFTAPQPYIPVDDYILVINDPYNKFLNITYLYGGNLSSTGLTLYDYIGFSDGPLKLVDVDVNGTYVVVVFDRLGSSVVKVYKFLDSLTGRHLFEQGYVVPGTPLNLKLMFINNKPYYLLYTSEGLQIISLEPLQLPLLRLETLLTFKFPEAKYADSLPDLSTVVVGGGNKLLVVKGLDSYLKIYGPKPVDLDRVKLPSLTVSVLAPNYTGLPNAKVILSYGNISREYLTDELGNVVFSNVFPGEYLVEVYPQVPHLDPKNLTINIPLGVPHVVYKVVLNYTLYELNLLIGDEFGGGPRVPLDIYVNKSLVVSEFLGESLSIKLPYGIYVVEVRPQRNYTYFYEVVNKTVTLDRDLTLEFLLTRKSYTVTINLVDGVTKELLSDNVLVIVEDIIKYVNASLTIVLKAGRYLVNVLIPPEVSDKYLSTSSTINVMTDSAFNIEIPRRSYIVNFTLIDSITNNLAIGLFNVYVNGSEVLVGTGSTFNITLPYGKYLIHIRPQPPYNAIYLSSDLSLEVLSSKSTSVLLDRVKYLLTIRFYDPISRVPIAPLKLTINNTLYSISKGTPSLTVPLPYGTYVIKLTPDIGFENVYFEYSTTVDVLNNTVIDLRLNRKYYNLNITISDVTLAPIIGLLDVEVNGTLVGKGVSNFFTTSLPCDTYLIVVKPQPPYAQIYSRSEVIVKLYNDTVVDVVMNRNYYTLTVVVEDDRANPVLGATVILVDTITGVTAGRGITGSDGKYVTSLYYGSFRLIVRYGGFYDYVTSIDLTTSITEKVVLTPLPLTILMRYIPLITVISLIVLSIVALMRLRSKITERLLRSEEIF